MDEFRSHGFGYQSLKDYHEPYSLSDVHLLTDVFDKFWKCLIKTHGLEPLHFLTLPVLAWAMALKHTDAELDRITDADAYLQQADYFVKLKH